MGLKAVSTSGGGSSSVISPPANLAGTGLTANKTAGENLSFGDIVYIKSDGKMWKGDADASLFPVQYMALGTIAANATGSFLLFGYARNDSWTWTVGGALYLSTTAGGITQTAPSTSGACIQVLGFAETATIAYFHPSPDYITHV